MRKLFRLLSRLLLFAIVIIAGVMGTKTVGFSSKQIPMESITCEAVDPMAIERFAQALRIPTISYEDHIDSSAFSALDSFIQKTYPLVDSLLEKKTINLFSYSFKWPGRNPKLNPVLLIAHLDVVPVPENDLAAWEEDPFGGKIRDGYLWGRGALDDKNSIFGLLEAVEALLKEDYNPERTLYLAFGHDEEVGGNMGAIALADYYKKEGIKFEYVLDEGQMIIENAIAGLDPPLAMIGIAEKGYTTLELVAQLEDGGHSSMPPTETAIGILSKAIHSLQQNPFPAKIDGAVDLMFQHIGPEMAIPNKIIFANLWLTESLVLNQLGQDFAANAMIRTTTAPTILKAGVKDNVLPTEAAAKINFRILPGENPQTVADYVRKTIADDRIKVVEGNPELSESPSLVSDPGAFGYQVIQKTIQQVFPGVIVSPSLVIAATDSRHYKTVSDQIYRFMPIQLAKDELKGLHGINERISVENFGKMICFYQQLIKNSCK